MASARKPASRDCGQIRVISDRNKSGFTIAVGLLPHTKKEIHGMNQSKEGKKEGSIYNEN
jgi:hypothetical protein